MALARTSTPPWVSDPGGRLADRYLSPSGDDNASGAKSAPWRTFSKAVAWVNSLPANSNVCIVVLTGNYFEQNSGLYFTNFTNTGVVVTVDFAYGVTATTSQLGGDGGNGIGCSDTVPATFNLRGARFTGTNQTSANGIGVHSVASAVVNGGGAIFSGYDDGWSNHSTSIATVRDCTFMDCSKAPLTHVDSAVIVAQRCTFIARAGAILGLGGMLNSSTGTFEDCTFIPATNGQNISIIHGCTFSRCTIGTLDAQVNCSIAANTWAPVFEDCYLNIWFSGGLGGSKFTRSFGKFGFNIRGLTAVRPLIENCVFVGSSQNNKFCVMANGYTANSFDPGTLTIRNSVFTGYTNFVDVATGNTSTTQNVAKDVINAQWTMQGICFNGVTTIMSPSTINLPSPYITSNPLLANPITTKQVDYNTSSNSPCRGAGQSGANIGLPV
jgi:hypothetical protein